MQTSIPVRVAVGKDFDEIRAFYARWTTKSIAPSQRFVIAQDGQTIIGAVRLCQEEGHMILRTMQIDERYHRQGIGTRMLVVLEPLLEPAPCYCLPYAHLPAFYSKIGFQMMPVEQAPPHLYARYHLGTAQGIQMHVMCRPAGPAL
jgi:N-acetylglutamate synthase-like GNAT family acetyltransferase